MACRGYLLIRWVVFKLGGKYGVFRSELHPKDYTVLRTPYESTQQMPALTRRAMWGWAEKPKHSGSRQEFKVCAHKKW